MDRLNQVLGHLSPSATNLVTSKNPDDVVIVASYRTAIGKGFKGSFKDVGSDYILLKFLEAFLAKTQVNPNLIEDIACANVLKVRSGICEHRAAAISAGIPYTTPIIAINRQCGSGLVAIGDIANKIISGEIDCGLAVGVESMTKDFGLGQSDVSKALENHPEMLKSKIPMGITNENIAIKYNISRKQQDEFAAKSFQKTEKALASGVFADEILPVESLIEEKDGQGNVSLKKLIVNKDEGVRKGVTAESLGKLRPVFKKDGLTHAGNSSQVSDGAAGVLLMRRSFAEENGFKIEGKFVRCVSVGVPPEIMGVGPAMAIPHILKKTNLVVDDIAAFEINEAFATQCLYSIKACNIPEEKVNINGGAIALGHPVGVTGARQYATILRLLKPGDIGLTSMCIGSGMGSASIVVKE